MKAQIIEKEGKFYKECGVVMLNTTSSKLLLSDDGQLFHYHKEQTGEGIIKPQHLYITSDEEIIEDDWCYDSKENKIFKCNVIAPYTVCKDNSKHISLLDDRLQKSFEIENCKKIIATTDTSLGYTDHRVSPVLNFCSFSKPSDKFIQAYINAYNKGEKIEKVWVEYDRYFEGSSLGGLIIEYGFDLKIKDGNDIVIKELQPTWEDIFEEFKNSFSSDRIEDFYSWVKNNYKIPKRK